MSNRTACVRVLTGQRIGMTTVLALPVFGDPGNASSHPWHEVCVGVGVTGPDVTRAVFASLSNSG